jgi:putative ABC transport system permease protein
VNGLWQDMRCARRSFLKIPGFVVLAVLTISLGVGANTAVFSVVKAVLLSPNPLGYRDIDRVAIIFHQNKFATQGRTFNSYREFRGLRDNTKSFQTLAAYIQNVPLILNAADKPTHLRANLITPSFFQVLGAHAYRGRLFADSDEVSSDDSVVLSYGIWERNFGSDPGVIGHSILLSNHAYSVMGVLPPDFHNFTAVLQSGFEADVFLNLAAAPQILDPAILDHQDDHIFGTVGRLNPEFTIAQSRGEISSVYSRLPLQRFDDNWDMKVDSVRDLVSRDVRKPLIVIFVITGMIFLISCTNVASLVLLRLTARKKELSVRLALGASRFRLLQQFVTEGLLLTSAGTAIGIWLAVIGKDALLRLSSVPLLSMIDVRMDWPVLMLSIALAVIGGLILGVIPAIAESGASATNALSSGDRTQTYSRTRFLFRKTLIGGQLAVAMMLLTGTVLMVRSFIKLHEADPGFRTDHLLTMRLDLSGPQYDQQERIVSLRQQLKTQLAALPGVETSILWAPQVPGDSFATTSAMPQFQSDSSHQIRIVTRYHLVSSNALQFLGIALRSGRDIRDEDQIAGATGAVISESLAKQLGLTTPIGARFRAFADGRLITVIGVARDVQHRGRTGPYADSLFDMYLPLDHFPRARDLTIVLRTNMPPGTLALPVQDLVQQNDKLLPVFDVRTMSEIMDEQEQEARFTEILMILFSALALSLTITGIYGVSSYSVRQRTREFGTRIAVGAQASDVFALVMWPNLLLAAISIVAGSIGSVAFSRLVRGLLFSVVPSDPLTYVFAGSVVMAVVCVACALPAWRATRVDPMIALRSE